MENEEAYVSSVTKLAGVLSIEGGSTYDVFVRQNRTRTTWILTVKDYFQNREKDNPDAIIAVVRTESSGKSSGYGSTFLITRILDNLNYCMQKAISADTVNVGFMTTGEYFDENSDGLSFSCTKSGIYFKLNLKYEGFLLTLDRYNGAIPKTPELVPMVDEKMKAALIATLGVKTAKQLKRVMGDRLKWYEEIMPDGTVVRHKKYYAVKTDAEFKAMMKDFLRTVVANAKEGKATLTGIDTETTGLNTFKLSPTNPYRDHIVAVPFSWRDNEACVIFVDMQYFSNVSHELLLEYFGTLFSRNPDFSYPDVHIEIDGEVFDFNRKFIKTTGHNTIFDSVTFMGEGMDVFFDEDTMQLGFNLATDWSIGRNGLKDWTRTLYGAETLELDELFGAAHKDKYAYLQDEELALIYGCADADYSRLIWKPLVSMTPKHLYMQYRKYDLCLMHLYSKAESYGMPVDTDAVVEQGNAIASDLETIREFVYSYAYIAKRKSLGEAMDSIRATLDKQKSVSQMSLSADKPSDLQKSVDEYTALDSYVYQADTEKKFRFPFTPRNHKDLLFNVLKYPVMRRGKDGDPSLDKFVLQKLMKYQWDTPHEILKEDIVSRVSGEPLISKKDFNNDKYPLARVLSTYAVLNKEYTAYYQPVIHNNLEGKLFFKFRTTKAATRRIINPGQTMKGALKKLVIAPKGYLFASWDASQIEYRHMASMAYIRLKRKLQKKYPSTWKEILEKSNVAAIVRLMTNPEADYHIETASQMTGIEQHLIDHKTRKRYKSIGFGIPYGLGETSMCESIYGRVTDENMKATKALLNDYYTKQCDIIDMIEEARDTAFKPADIPDEFRKVLDIGDTHVGIVQNFVGFYRMFILEGLDRRRCARIRRQAGNCIIQGGAAELFRRMLYNFYEGCVKAGIEDKIIWIMTVHDELDYLVKQDIDIIKLIEVLYTCCTLRFEDHIPYFIGINFGHNWYDAKDDSAELPVVMVERLVEAYHSKGFRIPCDGHQAENLLRLKRHYMCERVLEEICAIIPNFKTTLNLDVDKIDAEFKNYTVRAYMDVFISKEAIAKYGKKADVPLKARLECWLKEMIAYGLDTKFTDEVLETKYDIIPKEIERSYDFSIDEADLDSIELDDSDNLDLSIDLLDNSSEEAALEERQGSWFDERSLFDPDALEEANDENLSATVYVSDNTETEETYEENPNPTSEYDTYTMKFYVRKKVFATSATVFSVMTAGTSYYGNERDIKTYIKSNFNPGQSAIVIVGKTTLAIKGIDAEADKLDALDKYLLGEVH